MSIAPKLPKKLTILLQQHTHSPFPSHYPLSAADSVKEPQLIVKAVYVSSLTVITQCGITNRENRSEEGELLCVCYHGVNFLVMGTAAMMAHRDTSDLYKHSQTNNTCCVLTSMWPALQSLTQCNPERQCCRDPTHTYTHSVSSSHIWLNSLDMRKRTEKCA